MAAWTTHTTCVQSCDGLRPFAAEEGCHTERLVLRLVSRNLRGAVGDEAATSGWRSL